MFKIGRIEIKIGRIVKITAIAGPQQWSKNRGPYSDNTPFPLTLYLLIFCHNDHENNPL